ncbi:MAG: DUF3572 domain-containing protein [Alphaproteobacteria bacterium]|nr:DUF3572 domain-containing protein [Alphaproteobacteria bacterium]
MALKNPPKSALDHGAIALQLLGFIAADEDRLARFTALSGLGPGEMKDGLQNPVFLGFMLDYALQDEALILAFAESAVISPQAVANARRNFPGATDDF